jgi:OOP family OmpA-OmpF porin
LIVAVVLAACATTPELTREQVMMQDAQVASLDAALNEARRDGADLLAPDGYREAKAQLDKAIDAAAAGNTDAANTAARQGLSTLADVDTDLARSRDLLHEVVEARTRALQANAATLYSRRTAELDGELREAAGLVEHNELEDARDRRPELIDGYRQLELKALKQSTVDAAKAALEKARNVGAPEYAPKTYELARDEHDLALTVLDTDRTNTGKADAHASRARWVARRIAAWKS